MKNCVNYNSQICQQHQQLFDYWLRKFL